jgi:radical SAM protein with 4Fe4S-binding SPASM domain
MGLLEKAKFSTQARDLGIDVNGTLISECNSTTFTDEEFETFWRCFTKQMTSLLDIPYRKSINRSLSPCSVSRTNAFTVDVDGSIYMCLGDLGFKDRSIGTVNTDKISIYNKTIYEYLTIRPWDFPDCKMCKLLPICITERCIRLRMLNIDCTDKQKAMRKAIMLDMYDFAIGLDKMSQFKFDHSEFSEDLFYEIKQ